jgi:hypothetical protein
MVRIVRYSMLSSTGEPLTLTEALNDSKWHEAMKEEYTAEQNLASCSPHLHQEHH